MCCTRVARHLSGSPGPPLGQDQGRTESKNLHSKLEDELLGLHRAACQTFANVLDEAQRARAAQVVAIGMMKVPGAP